MTHTEESLMELADRFAVAHALVIRFGSERTAEAMKDRDALRVAIREVLAERDEAVNAYAHLHDMYESRGDALRIAGECHQETADQWKTRCEQAEAEVERLKAGGCARNQGLTQYCAEAEALRKELERYRWIEKQIDIYGAEWAPATVANAIVRGDGARLDDAIDTAIKDQP